jgi:hypothetical protein
MHDHTLEHEDSEVHLAALDLFRSILEVARKSHRSVEQQLRHYGLRVLQHSATAGTSLGWKLRAAAVGYARLSLVKVAAAIDAAVAEGSVDDPVVLNVRRALQRSSQALIAVVTNDGSADVPADVTSSDTSDASEEPPSLESAVFQEWGLVPVEWEISTLPADADGKTWPQLLQTELGSAIGETQ